MDPINLLCSSYAILIFIVVNKSTNDDVCDNEDNLSFSSLSLSLFLYFHRYIYLSVSLYLCIFVHISASSCSLHYYISFSSSYSPLFSFLINLTLCFSLSAEVRQHQWFLHKLPAYLALPPEMIESQERYIDKEIVNKGVVYFNFYFIT